jgi:hypothetical protein
LADPAAPPGKPANQPPSAPRLCIRFFRVHKLAFGKDYKGYIKKERFLGLFEKEEIVSQNDQKLLKYVAKIRASTGFRRKLFILSGVNSHYQNPIAVLRCLNGN